MANLEFCDTHNMVAYLHKTKGSEGFHQIVDFLNTSHIKYALTENPTIHVSLIQQFWQTAAANTLNSGDVQITATIDGKVKLVFEASIRRHLKLEDSDGITTFPNIEIFEQLTLMGYVSNFDKLTFQKGHVSPQWRFLIHTILHCLSPKKTAWEQFSSNIATAIICLATNRTHNYSKMIFEGMMKNLDSKSKFLKYPRFIQIFFNKHKRRLLPHNRTYIAPTLRQKLFSNMRRASKGYVGVDTPLFQTMLVQGPILQANEVAFTSVDVVHGGAATTVSSIDAGHGSEQNVKTSQARRRAKIVVLDDEESSEDTFKQGRMIEDIDEDAGISLVTPIKKNVNTYTRRRRAISTDNEGVSTTSRIFSTAKESVSTTGASMPVSTTSMVQQVNIIIPSSSETTETTKDKEQEAKLNAEQEDLLASETTKDEANPSVADIDWDDVQAQIQTDEHLAQKLLDEE
ncbi:hypothetical protein Tco_0881648 [Tanacetum coccineum]